MAVTLSNKVYIDFNDAKSLDLKTARTGLVFPMEREKIQSMDSNKVLNKSVLFHTAAGDSGNERRTIGYISESRKIIPYTEIMDWITEELSKVTNFKLIESSLQGKQYRMYQKYILDQDIENPDGEKLSPMLIVNGSYVGLPVSFELGTFRYICANGAMVKVKDFERVAITANDLDSLHRSSLGTIVAKGLDNMKEVSKKYAELASEDWDVYLPYVLSDPNVQVSVKKSIVDYLISEGSLEQTVSGIVKGDSYLSLTLDRDTKELKDKLNNSIFKITNNKSAWDFYNDCTNISTHRSPSLAIQRNTDRMISNIFVA